MLKSWKFWLLLAVAAVVSALGAAWTFFSSVNSPQPVSLPWSTVLAIGLGGGIIIGVIVGLMHRYRRQ